MSAIQMAALHGEKLRELELLKIYLVDEKLDGNTLQTPQQAQS